MHLNGQNEMCDRAFEHDACGVGLVANLDNIASHDIVSSGLTVLKRLMHRGATGNDPETGDGAGLLVQLPDAFFRKLVKGLPPKGEYGVAMIFGAVGEEPIIEHAVKDSGAEIIAWREVPVVPEAVGPVARRVLPKIRQLFVGGADEAAVRPNQPSRIFQYSSSSFVPAATAFSISGWSSGFSRASRLITASTLSAAATKSGPA